MVYEIKLVLFQKGMIRYKPDRISKNKPNWAILRPFIRKDLTIFCDSESMFFIK